MLSRVFRTAVVTLGLVALYAASAMAHEAAVEVDVAKELELARAAFQPIAPTQVAQARQTLRVAVQNLERYLAGGGTQKASGWRNYLHLDVVAKHAASSGEPDVRALEAALGQFEAQTAGLERPRFISARHALRQYLHLVTVAADAKAAESYNAHLDAIARSLAGEGGVSPAERDLALENAVTWLSRSGRAPRLVQGLRARNSYANFQLRASARLITAGLDQEVDDTQPIHDTIMKTRIHGTAHTVGAVKGALIPNDSRGTFEIRLQAITRSKNVGYNGPVTIYSTGLTQVTAAKQVYFEPTGFLSSCAWARCDTDSNIYAICARCQLIERMAWKRAGQQQGQAEQIASRHAEQRVISGMEERAAKPLNEANEKYQERVRGPLLRRDAFPTKFASRSTTEALFVTALQASAGGLGAPNAGPGLPEGYDIAVRSHQSSVNNFTTKMLGGYLLTDLRLVELIRDDLKMEVPPELETKDDEDEDDLPEPGEKQPNWTITFSHERPFAVVFEPGQITMTIRGDRFTSGRRVVRKSMEIGAVYKIVERPEGPTLVRQGEVEAKYVNREPNERESIQENAMKTTMRRKFAAMFKPEFPEPAKPGEPAKPRGIKLSGRWEKAGPLLLKLLESNDGWLGVGFNSEPAVSHPGDTTTAQVDR